MKYLVMLFCTLLQFISSSQEFGGNPTSLKWRQVNTDTVRVIFPESLEKQAQRVASLVYQQASANGYKLGNKLHKINIVLQNQTTITNGYVSLAPYRSEFYMTPSLNNFDIGSINWTDQLAIHEYRHVQQINNFKNGGTKLLSFVLGEEGWGLGMGLTVPNWFFEGDAVYNETILSKQGRGRLPFFLNEYKSLWLANKNYSWMKLRNGSLKDYVPSHYPLGYLLVNYGYEKYGNEFWEDVTHDATSFKRLFYAYQKAIKRYSNKDYKTFTKEAFDFYKGQMNSSGKKGVQQNVEQHTDSGIQKITHGNKNYVTNYTFPYQAGGDSLFFVKSSYRQNAGFYINDKDGEKRLRVKDISLDDHYVYKNGKIVYATYKPDARRGWKDYSELRILDIKSGKQKKITTKTKYFSPDISDDGKNIVAVYLGTDGTNSLHIISSENGEVISKIKNDDNLFFTDPKFLDNDHIVSAAKLRDGRMGLVNITVADGTFDWLVKPSYTVVGFPNAGNGKVYFSANSWGNDELFYVGLKDKKIFQGTQSALGNYNINEKDGKSVWSRFGADGYQLYKSDNNQMLWNEVNPMAFGEQAGNFIVSNKENTDDILNKEDVDKRFAISKYNKNFRLYNFHSWRPYYEDPEFTFSLYSDNILNTLSSELYYKYNQNERSHTIGYSDIYGGWYPFISTGIEYTANRNVPLNNNIAQLNSWEARLGLQLPLNLSGGKMFRNTNIGVNYIQSQQRFTGYYKDSLGVRNFGYLHYFASWSQQIQKARQHIFPRLGWSVAGDYRQAVIRFNGYQLAGAASIFLPGVFVNNNLVLSGSFQERDTARALFSNIFANSRGYSENYFSRMWRTSANYHFTIAYPDWGFGNLLYFLRVRGNAFYDFSKVYSNNKLNTADLRSTGMEVFFDTRVWNYLPVSFGFRVSHLLNDDLVNSRKKGANVFEFIVPIDLIPR